MKFVYFALVIAAVTAYPFEYNEDNEVYDEAAEEYLDISHLGNTIYGEPKNETGDRVSEWDNSSNANPEELGEYAEGDILFPLGATAGRNGMRGEASRWERGIVPYVIEGYFNQKQNELIMQAIADYHRLSCIRFVKYSGQADYLSIQSRNTGCWSSVGRIGGKQVVNLQNPGCLSRKGTVLHELYHALGFLHEQSRHERDEYVSVKYGNVKKGSENNFQKASEKDTSDFNVPYDYNSVMHYSEYAFSSNGEKTIVPKVSGVTLGQRSGLSRGDVKKLNKMYECKNKEPEKGWLGSVWAGLFGSDE